MNDRKATRRNFVLRAGAAVAAPVALVSDATGGVQSSVGLQARIAELEDADALRRLTGEFIALVNEGKDSHALLNAVMVEIETGDFDSLATSRIRADRQYAEVCLPCKVATHEAIDAPDSGLVDMARLQGEGVVRQERRQELWLRFSRTVSGWIVTDAELEDSV